MGSDAEFRYSLMPLSARSPGGVHSDQAPIVEGDRIAKDSTRSVKGGEYAVVGRLDDPPRCCSTMVRPPRRGCRVVAPLSDTRGGQPLGRAHDVVEDGGKSAAGFCCPEESAQKLFHVFQDVVVGFLIDSRLCSFEGDEAGSLKVLGQVPFLIATN